MNKPKNPELETKFSTGEEISFDNACAYAEGFGEGEDAPVEDQIRAWAYLIRTGHVWHLQGFFGREANNLIEGGVINHQGVINWDNVNIAEG